MTDVNKTFNDVRPYCVELIQMRNLHSLKKLYTKLKSLDKESIDEIVLYVLFPFRVILRKQEQQNEEFLICMIDCLAYLFNSSTINDWGAVNELLTGLCSVISNSQNNEVGATGSEEVKKGVASALWALLDHTSLPVWQNLYHYLNIPLIGHLVTLLLSVAKSNIERKARLTALSALKSLCKPEYLNSLEESSQNTAKRMIGNCMACFLPGVATALSKIIAGDTNAGLKIKSTCLEVIGDFIIVTLGDDNISNSATATTMAKSDIDVRLKALIVTRDEKWVTNAGQKLIPIIENACSASNSEEWSVRLSCVNFCEKILLQCSESMKNHANTLLKIPVKLLNDNYKQIREKCNKILDKFSSSLQETKPGSRVLLEILEENLFALCTSLPRLMRTIQDAEKSSTLKILLGYLTLLKNKINNLLYSQPHLKQLSSALLHSFELNLSSIQLMDVVESSVFQDSNTKEEHLRTCFRKQFCHFRDDDIYNTLRAICNVLGQYGDLEILLDHFSEFYNTSETHCKQAVLVLNEILIGAKGNDKVNHCIQSLLDQYLSSENWYLATTSDSDYIENHHQTRVHKMNSGSNLAMIPLSMQQQRNEMSLKSLKSNVLLCCLHLESILTISYVMGESFRSVLMFTLYPLLEKTTDSNTSIASCALRAMQGVAINCGYDSASELIAENSDYLISDISIQIHRLEMFPRCPSVLKAMLDHSMADILPLVSDTIDEILSSLDIHHLEPRRLIVFLPVLLAVEKAIIRWSKCEEIKDNGDSIKDEPNRSGTNGSGKNAELNVGEKSFQDQNVETNGENRDQTPRPVVKERTIQHKIFVENLRKQLLEFQKNKEIADLELEVEIDPNWKPGEEEDAQYQHQDQEEETKKPSMEIQITTKVLSRCLHLMSHSDARIRMRIMEIIETGMLVLKSCENELLPMAHKLWNPLIARFGDEELQVVMKAFETLCVIASFSKVFLRKRLSKEILPKILSILEKQAKHSSSLRKKTVSNPAIRIHKQELLVTPQETISYTHSVAFKLQNLTLKDLGPLLKHIEITRNDHISVCVSCMPYLSSKQPLLLQKAAIELFKNLIEVDSDLTWLELTRVWCRVSKLVPDFKNCDFRTVHLGGSTDVNTEFASNIRVLLDLC